MSYKWMGALLIIISCGGFGIHLANACRREESALRQLINTLELMECQLQYRLTPLPELCRQMGQESRGCIQRVLLALARELDAQIAPEVSRCMQAALGSAGDIPPLTKGILLELGHSLGRFDLSGQLKGLEGIRSDCSRLLSEISHNQAQRLRSYQTLGFCAGAALAILLV